MARVDLNTGPQTVRWLRHSVPALHHPNRRDPMYLLELLIPSISLHRLSGVRIQDEFARVVLIFTVEIEHLGDGAADTVETPWPIRCPPNQLSSGCGR